MKLSEMITLLTSALAAYGDIPITKYYDGWEYEPRLGYSDTQTEWKENGESEEVPAPKRMIIR